MSTIRVASRKRYTSVSNETLEDSDLTWEARGLLVYLLSKPDDWAVNREHLMKQAPNGQHQVRRILKELTDAGYLVRRRFRRDGQLLTETVVYETPPVRSDSNHVGDQPVEDRPVVVTTEGTNTTEAAPPASAPEGFPSDAEDGMTYARTLAKWLRGRGVEMPPANRRDEAYVAVMRSVDAMLDPNSKTRTVVAQRVIAEYVEDVGDRELPGEAWGHLGALVKNHGPVVALKAMVEAIGWGAGLTAQYADDPIALTKYVNGILCKKAKAA